MTTILESEHYTVYLLPDNEVDTDTRHKHYCLLNLNAASFGYATNTFFRLSIRYDVDHAFMNFEKPDLPTYYETPRSALKDIVNESSNVFIPAPPNMKFGDRISDCIKISWDYLCPHIDEYTKYVHPEEDRLLIPIELATILGCNIGDVPPKIIEYIKKQMSLYAYKLWKEDFSARYDRFNNRWYVDRHTVKTPTIKHFDFTQWTPRLVCPVSDRYPGAH